MGQWKKTNPRQITTLIPVLRCLGALFVRLCLLVQLLLPLFVSLSFLSVQTLHQFLKLCPYILLKRFDLIPELTKFVPRDGKLRIYIHFEALFLTGFK